MTSNVMPELISSMLGIPTRCGQCACTEEENSIIDAQNIGSEFERFADQSKGFSKPGVRPAIEKGLTSYAVDVHQPLQGPPLRVGDVWHLPPDEVRSFQRASLSLHANGICIRPQNGRLPITISWSPFSLVQACRLHTEQADAARPWMRLFKVSVFHHGITHLFAVEGEAADSERARWVADIACALRVLTQSLFPNFRLSVQPVAGALWTSTRLLAGYMLMCESNGVQLVFCELHSHWDNVAAFVAYEDEFCDARVLHIPMGVQTGISERVGVDCSCFIIGSNHFSTRSCSEKALWLRAISNVKVKLRHCATNPTSAELTQYRSAIYDSTKDMPTGDEGFTQKALLPKRSQVRHTAPAADKEPEVALVGGPGISFAPGRQEGPPAPQLDQVQKNPTPRPPPADALGKQNGKQPPPLPTSLAALGPVLTPPQLPMLIRETGLLKNSGGSEKTALPHLRVTAAQSSALQDIASSPGLVGPAARPEAMPGPPAMPVTKMSALVPPSSGTFLGENGGSRSEDTTSSCAKQISQASGASSASTSCSDAAARNSSGVHQPTSLLEPSPEPAPVCGGSWQEFGNMPPSRSLGAAFAGDAARRMDHPFSPASASSSAISACSFMNSARSNDDSLEERERRHRMETPGTREATSMSAISMSSARSHPSARGLPSPRPPQPRETREIGDRNAVRLEAVEAARQQMLATAELEMELTSCSTISARGSMREAVVNGHGSSVVSTPRLDREVSNVLIAEELVMPSLPPRLKSSSSASPQIIESGKSTDASCDQPSAPRLNPTPTEGAAAAQAVAAVAGRSQAPSADVEAIGSRELNVTDVKRPPLGSVVMAICGWCRSS